MKPTPVLVADIIDNLRRVFQVVHERSKRAEQETGLTGSQLWAVKIVAESAPIKVSDLARFMYLHPATVVGIVDRLESRGLVQRKRSTTDRRVVEIALTAEGEEKVRQSPEVAQGLLIKGLETLDAKKLNTVAGGLEQLVHILGAEQIPPQLFLSTDVNGPPQKRGRSSLG